MQVMTDEQLEILAKEHEKDFVRRARSIHDFRYDEQQEKYWDTTTGNLLGAKSVNGAIKRTDWPVIEVEKKGEVEEVRIRPSEAINDVDSGLTVEGSTWWPGLPKFIEDIVITDRGAFPMKGAACYNCYVPPTHDLSKVFVSPEPWIDHVKKLFSDPLEHEHFFDFAAHMIQKPDEKVNHGIVIAGSQGIGKDTALLPLRKGVGEWNAAEIGPDAITGQYNGFVKSVLLVINEVRPQEEDHKASNFYNLLKPILACPPDMIPMNLKYANTIYVRNLCHVVLTTNDPLTMYIPEEDRRLFVMTSTLEDPKISGDFEPGYFDNLHDYLNAGGMDSVIKWLKMRDISSFNSAAPPPMTAGKRAIVDSASQVRRTLVDEVLEVYSAQFSTDNSPLIIFHKDLKSFVLQSNIFDDKGKVLKLLDAKNFHFKMADRGYRLVLNPNGNEWRNGNFRSRIALAHRSVEKGREIELVEEELKRRPLVF